MTWFKVDDSFYDHPKIFDAPDSAVALWVRAGSWSARNLTDGFVPAKMPARLCDDPGTAIRELVERGLWRRTKGGYQFHDWTDYQPTKEEVERDREKAAERQRRRRAKLKDDVNSNGVTDMSRRDSRVSSTGSHDVSSGAPSRPVPSRPEGTRTVQVSQSVQVRTARESGADDDSIDLAIVVLIHELTGDDISALDAAKIRHRILDGRAVKRRAAYVAKAIRERPRDFLPEPGQDAAPLRAVPDWCGHCDPHDRRLELADGTVARCPACHPLAERRPA